MSLQLSVAARNAVLDSLEVLIGTSPVLKIRSGSVPATCATADSGTVLATLNLPSNWLVDAAAGAKVMTGTWEDTAADAGAPTNAGHFRLYASGGTCHMQGTITATGGGGDLTLDNLSIALGQPVTITSFTLAQPNS